MRSARSDRLFGSLRFRLTFWNTVGLLLLGAGTLVGLRQGLYLTLSRELNRLTVGGFFEIALVTSCALPTVLGSYAFFAGRARKHLSRPESVRWVQRGTGAVMAGAAVAVATR